jgi:hypothetical protein
MPTGQDLDRARISAVSGDRSVVVTVGADQIGKDLRVTGVGLRPRDVVPVAITRDRERVDRIELIARGDQRLHPQAAIGLDPDHDLMRSLSMSGDDLMERADPRQSLRQPPTRQRLASFVHQMHIVMIFCPVVPDEQHRVVSPSRVSVASRRATSGDLMNQCSRHDTPSALCAALTDQPGHDLTLGMEVPGGSSAHRPAAPNQPRSLNKRSGRPSLGGSWGGELFHIRWV